MIKGRQTNCLQNKVYINWFVWGMFVCIVLFSVIASYGTIRNILHIQSGTIDNPLFSGALAVFISIGVFSLIRIVFRWFDLHNNQSVITIILFSILGIILLVLILSFRITPNGDSLDDIDTAYYLLSHNIVEENIVHAPFIRAYGNNYFLIISLQNYLKLFRLLGINDYIRGLSFINAFSILIAHVFLWLTAKRIKSKQYANKILFLCVINPVYYGLVFWIYSLTLSLPLMTGGLYVAVRLIQSEKTHSKIAWAVFEGVFLFAGFCLRPTAIFPLIALIIYLIIYYKFSLTKVVVSFTTILVTVVLLFVSWDQIQSNTFALYKEKNLPVTYWLTIGSHGDGTLVTQKQKDMSTLINIEPEKKIGKGLEITADYYKENGIINTIILWANKNIITWSDGYSGINERINLGETDSNSFAYIAGDRSQFLRLYSQCYRLILLLCAAGFCILSRKKERSSLSVVAVITLFGAVVFYTFWEAKNVYSAPFILFLIILGADFIPIKLEKINCKIANYKTINYIISVIYCFFSVMLCIMLFCSCSRVTRCIDSYLQATKHNRVPMQIENTEEIRQSFSIRNSFNQIRLKATCEHTNDDEVSKYKLTLYDMNNDIACIKEISVSLIKEGAITIILQKPIDAGQYILVLEKINKELLSIDYYTQDTYYVDFYEGKLTSQNKQYISDLVMDISNETEKPYYPIYLSVLLSVFLFILFNLPIVAYCKRFTMKTKPIIEK